MSDHKDYAKIGADLYRVVAGKDGLACAGSCVVESPCVCKPAFQAVAGLNDAKAVIERLTRELDEALKLNPDHLGRAIAELEQMAQKPTPEMPDKERGYWMGVDTCVDTLKVFLSRQMEKDDG